VAIDLDAAERAELALFHLFDPPEHDSAAKVASSNSIARQASLDPDDGIPL